jgi:hypothetical protein
MSIELDNHITGAAYQLYKYTYLLRSTDLGAGKMLALGDRIFDETRVILAECSVYALSIEDADSVADTFSHFQRFVTQSVNIVNVSITLIYQNHEQFSFDDIQLAYIGQIEQHFRELTQQLDTWASTHFGQTIFASPTE